jgi:hypothetical protein
MLQVGTYAKPLRIGARLKHFGTTISFLPRPDVPLVGTYDERLRIGVYKSSPARQQRVNQHHGYLRRFSQPVTDVH